MPPETVHDDERVGSSRILTSTPELEAGVSLTSGGVVRAGSSVDLEAGLDALSTPVETRVPLGRRLRTSVLPPVVFLVLLLLAWQAVVWSGIKRRDQVPGPSDVWQALLDRPGDVWLALHHSVERGLVGFVAAAVIATPLGVIVARVPLVRAAAGPFITALQVLPSVAWVPAAIIWFGLTNATIYFVILMGAIPSIINGLVAGVDQVPPLYRRVGTVLGAGRWDMVRHVLLPAAFPGYLAGLKQGWAFSWRSLMAAEIIAVGGEIDFGLGALLQQGRELGGQDVVILAIFGILAVGVAIELLFFAPLERRVLRSRGLALSRD